MNSIESIDLGMPANDVTLTRDDRERELDRTRFLVVLLGALVGGGAALGLVEATMSWLPDPGPMVPFTTFVGALLGLFSAAFVAAHVIREDEVEGPLPVLVPREIEWVEAVQLEEVRGHLKDELGRSSWAIDVRSLPLSVPSDEAA